MTHEEFMEALYQQEDLLGEAINKPSEEEFRVITQVYLYHPSFHYSSEEARTQIAELYAKFGMIVLWDMLPRAEANRRAKDDMKKAENGYLTAEEAYQKLYFCGRLPDQKEAEEE